MLTGVRGLALQGGHHMERHNNHKRRRHRGRSKLLFDDDTEGKLNGTSVGTWVEMAPEEAGDDSNAEVIVVTMSNVTARCKGSAWKIVPTLSVEPPII